MPPCHGGGRGFESRPVRKSPGYKPGLFIYADYVGIIQSELDISFYNGHIDGRRDSLHMFLLVQRIMIDILIIK